MPTGPVFAELLAALAASLTASFASSVAAQPEDQLKAPVKALLEAHTHRVIARSEAQVADLGGRPDFGVEVNGLLAGYVELKAPVWALERSALRTRATKRSGTSSKPCRTSSTPTATNGRCFVRVRSSCTCAFRAT